MSTRADGKVQPNKATLTLENASGGSPTYHLVVTRDIIKVFDQSLRFAAFRDLYAAININNECDELLKVPFPPTLAKSSLGIKLTPEELKERFDMLDQWFQALLLNFNEFSPTPRVAICKFLDVPEASLELVAPAAADGDGESGAAGPQKGMFSSLLGKKKSTKTAGAPSEIDDAASVVSASVKQGSARAASVSAEIARPAVPQLTVYVSRGSVISGHPTYELNITFAANQRPFVLSKEFKHYRALMEDLRSFGIGYIETGEEGASPDKTRRTSLSRPSEAPGANIPVTTPLDAPFPKTHAKSSLGISLSEDDLRDRCMALDMWMRSVAENYFLFDIEAKKKFNIFLGYSEEFPDEVLYHIIERLNMEESVKPGPKSSIRRTSSGSSAAPAASPATNSAAAASATPAAPALTAAAVAAASAQAAQQSPTATSTALVPVNDRDSVAISEYDASISFNRKVRSDTKYQANEISITSEEQSGHPVFVLSISRDGLVKAKLTHRFAPYRDLYTSIVADETVKRCVSFPETLKKSAFGVKLNAKELEIRRAKLENWWIDLLDNFDDLSEDTKHSVSEFLTLPVALLRLSVPAPPPPPTASKGVFSKVLSKTVLSATAEEGSQASDDQDNGDWEDIGGAKPQVGCCVIS